MAVSIPFRPPEPAPASEGTVVLSPQQRPAGPAPKPFVLKGGDRVLFLGDRLLQGEAEHGYLETRLAAHYPTEEVVFRNHSAATNHPLARTGAAGQAPADVSFGPLLQRVKEFNPTVIFLGFGTDAALQGTNTLGNFRTNYSRLLTDLLGPDTNVAPRMVLLSPLSCEDRPGTLVEVTNFNQAAREYAQAIWEISTNHNLPLIDLYRWLYGEGRALQQAAGTTGKPIPHLTEDGLRLNRFGYWRMALRLQSGLRWRQNNWRFGYMGDGTLRSGQFGIELVERQRTKNTVDIRAREERLPMPSLREVDDLEESMRPQCYIQITGLDPGNYSLTVDGQTVASGTEADWARYRVVTSGPSWEQAEKLRQTIVRKNALLRGVDSGSEAGVLEQVRALEAEIARLRQPVTRKFVLRQS